MAPCKQYPVSRAQLERIEPVIKELKVQGI